ncbi:DUF481 domain-containing protein [bacterium]|nr:DUF481 domain-containing protein [bacterium]
MKRLVIGLFLSSLILTGVTKIYAEEEPWESNISLGVNATRGNVDSVFTTFLFDTQKKRTDSLFRGDFSVAYGESDNETTTNEIMLSSQYNKNITDRTFWSLMGSAEFNELSGIDSRYTGALGYGYYFIKEAKRLLEFSAGVGYIAEKFDTGKDNNYFTTFLAERYEHKMENSKLWNNLAFYPEVSDFSNFILKGEIGFEANINSKLGLRLVLKDIFNNTVEAGRDKNDVIIMSLLSYKI